MRTSQLAVTAAMAVWLMCLAASPSAVQERSVASGVFTEAQATRGADLYTRECASCHQAGLEGDGSAPALAGAEFLANWDGTTVGDLFERIRISMPPGNPSAVDAQGKIDIVAHVLRVNTFPAGATELGKDVEPLRLIKIEPPK